MNANTESARPDEETLRQGEAPEGLKAPCGEQHAASEGTLALSRQAISLAYSGRLNQALTLFDRALVLSPNSVAGHFNRGSVMMALKRFDDALASYERALALDASHRMAINGRMCCLTYLRRLDEARNAAEQLVSADPAFSGGLGRLLTLRRRLFNWDGDAELAGRIATAVQSGGSVCGPLDFLGVSGSVIDQLACAKSAAQELVPAGRDAGVEAERAVTRPPATGRRIRVAYVSPDFCDHAVTILMAGVFEHHDRTRFETVGISLNGESQQVLGQRVKAAFERFVDVSCMGDQEVVTLMRDMEIDIAVDLAGYTRDARTGIFARRAAPVQVNYLGFPGTMGASFMDYLIADDFTIPAECQGGYAEKVVWLPECFQANDDERPSLGVPPARVEQGLPEHGFVFCAWHRAEKLNPEMFDVWMRILRAVPDSILWLLADTEGGRAALRRAADAKGVAPERLQFADKARYAEYLARLQVADLYLDTLPFNGGTMVSDALWAGVPVLTCPGEAFAARMGGSLLRGVGLAELIARDAVEYETMAIALANDPARMTSLRLQLQGARTTSALFDTARFTRHLESAFETMLTRAEAGLAPTAFAVMAQPVAGAGRSAAEAAAEAGDRAWKSGRPREAQAAYSQAVELAPDDARVWHNLGVALEELNRLDAAEDALRRAIALDPAYAAAHGSLGRLLTTRGQRTEAEVALRRAIALNPNGAAAHCNLGMLLAALGRLPEAESSYRRAIACNCSLPESWNNLASVLDRLGRAAEAESAYSQAIVVRPEFAAAHFGLGLALLRRGDFARGWQEYGWLWSCQGSPRALAASAWETGRNLAGRPVFLHAEQGLGDELFFLRFVALLRQLGAGRVRYRAGERIAGLVARAGVVDAVVGPKEMPATEELVFSVADLPRLVGMTGADEMPAPVGQEPLAERVASIRSRLAALGPGPYLGVTWRAGTVGPNKLFKAVPARELAAALRGVKATVVVVQRKPETGEVADFAAALGAPAHDWSAENEDLEGMLALLACLDGYVGVPNTNVHLRAGLGLGAQVLVPMPPEWRWMEDGAKSPWFAGMRVYRQAANGDWAGALAALADDLKPEAGMMATVGAKKHSAELEEHRPSRNSLEQVRVQYRAKLAADPQNAELLYLLGTIEYRLDNAQEGLRLLNDSLDLDSGRVQAHHHRALALCALGRDDDALAAFECALALAPDCADVHFNLGALLAEMGRKEQAIASLERALAFDPDHTGARVCHGNLLDRMRRLDEAQKGLHFHQRGAHGI